MPGIITVVLAIALALGGVQDILAAQISKESADNQNDKVEESAKKPEDTSPQENIPADYYQQLGLPSIKQAWSPFDYINAANILASLVKQSPQKIPHYNDPVGRAYMEHMADGNNLYNTLRFANTHEQRLELIMLYLDGLQRLFTVYQQVLSDATPYYAEWIDIIGLNSYLAALSQPEWDFYLQQAAQNNTRGFNNAAIDQKIQATTILQTALVNPVIAGVQFMPKLSTTLAWRLLQQLNYSLPTYAHSLPLEALERLQQAFINAYQQSKDAKVRNAIHQLINEGSSL